MGKGGRCVWLTTLPPSYADCLEIWEPQLRGTLSRPVMELFYVYFSSHIKPWICLLKPLNAELNSICHLLTLLGAHHILHVSRIRVNTVTRIFYENLF